MIEISVALASLKATIDIARIGIEARDDAKAKHALSAMAGLLFDANMSALALSERTRALDAQLAQATQQLRDLQERVRQQERYVIQELRQGAFVYAYRPLEGDSTPGHYVCQNCFDKGITSVLRLQLGGQHWGEKMVCAEVVAHAIDM